MALVRERTIPTERPPPVGAVSANFCGWRGVTWSAQRIPTAVNICFLDRSRYFFIQVAPQLTSWGWVNPVPDPLLLRKSGSAGNRTRDLCICIQKLWPLDHRGGQNKNKNQENLALRFKSGEWVMEHVVTCVCIYTCNYVQCCVIIILMTQLM